MAGDFNFSGWSVSSIAPKTVAARQAKVEAGTRSMVDRSLGSRVVPAQGSSGTTPATTAQATQQMQADPFLNAAKALLDKSPDLPATVTPAAVAAPKDSVLGSRGASPTNFQSPSAGQIPDVIASAAYGLDSGALMQNASQQDLLSRLLRAAQDSNDPNAWRALQVGLAAQTKGHVTLPSDSVTVTQATPQTVQPTAEEIKAKKQQAQLAAVAQFNKTNSGWTGPAMPGYGLVR